MLQYKKILRWIWILMIVFSLLIYMLQPERFTAQNFQEFFHGNESLVFASFILISSIRALFFLPSTIFVLMGVALYPDNPLLVLTISMIGIMIGAWLVFEGAKFLTPEELLSARNKEKMDSVHDKMERYGFGIVLLWSFFPIVPTDLICYVAGTIRMTLWKFLLAVFVGEVILVSIYVWTGKSLFSFL